MTLISALHYLSRSIGLALLVASASGKLVTVYFAVGELITFFIVKIVRGGFYWFPQFRGVIAILIAIVARFMSKIVADYSGFMHMRHPYVGERASRENEKEERIDEYYCHGSSLRSSWGSAPQYL